MLNRRHSAHHCPNDSEPPIATASLIPKTREKKEQKQNEIKTFEKEKFKSSKQYRANERYGWSESEHSLVLLVCFFFSISWKRHTHKHTYAVIMLMAYTSDKQLKGVRTRCKMQQVIEHSLSSGEYDFFSPPMNRRKTPLLAPQPFLIDALANGQLSKTIMYSAHREKSLVANVIYLVNITICNIRSFWVDFGCILATVISSNLFQIRIQSGWMANWQTRFNF